MKLHFLLAALLAANSFSASAQQVKEKLNRAPVAVKTSQGILVSWRSLTSDAKNLPSMCIAMARRWLLPFLMLPVIWMPTASLAILIASCLRQVKRARPLPGTTCLPPSM